MAHEANSRPSQPAQPLFVAPSTNYYQGQFELIAGFDSQVEAFVGDKAAQDEEVVSNLYVLIKREAGGLHRRWDDHCFAPIVFLDAFGHDWRIGNKVIDTLCAALIPDAQPGDQKRQDAARHFAQLLAL